MQQGSELTNENHRNLRKLILSARTTPHTTNLLVAICDDPIYRAELIRTYEAELTAKDRGLNKTGNHVV